jgi:hypothetical protein
LQRREAITMVKFKKVLLVLTNDADLQKLPHVMKLCKNFQSKLFVLFIIESNRISRLASFTHQKVANLHKKIEEQGWRILYLVEDEAAENSVWTSLHLEDGNMMNIIRKYVQSYNIDIIITERRKETRKIFVSSPTPVMGL